MYSERGRHSPNNRFSPGQRRAIAVVVAGAALAGCGGYSTKELDAAAAKVSTSQPRPTPTPEVTGEKTTATCSVEAEVEAHTVRVSTHFENLPGNANVSSRYTLTAIGKDKDKTPVNLTHEVSGRDGTIFRDVPNSSGKVGNAAKINGYDTFCDPANINIDSATFEKNNDFSAAQPEPYAGVRIPLHLVDIA